MNCQHEIPYEDRAGHLKSKSCPKDGGRDGWCPDHAHSRELLAKGARLGYPAIDELHLSAGRLAWEAYAECFPRTIEIMKKGKQHIINRYDEVIGLLDAKLRDSLHASRIAPNGSQIDERWLSRRELMDGDVSENLLKFCHYTEEVNTIDVSDMERELSQSLS